ncbi:hypothetical protein CBL_04469 [Carabus blaptoides fortunei]
MHQHTHAVLGRVLTHTQTRCTQGFQSNMHYSGNQLWIEYGPVVLCNCTNTLTRCAAFKGMNTLALIVLLGSC